MRFPQPFTQLAPAGAVARLPHPPVPFGWKRDLGATDKALCLVASAAVLCRGPLRPGTAKPCRTAAWLAGSVLFSVAVLQELYRQTFLRPRLVPAEELAVPASTFESVDDAALRVHVLTSKASSGSSDKGPTISLLHGFGASSLSWLPVLDKLSDAVGATALAHDALGFGLTRSLAPQTLRDPASFSHAFNAKVARQLLARRPIASRGGESILVGHSMGSIAAAIASTELDSPTSTTLVLVAPALQVPSERSDATARGSRVRWWCQWRDVVAQVQWPLARLWQFLWDRLVLPYAVRPFLMVSLRSAVYSSGFWEKGLRRAWSDPKRVDSDVLARYRWPSLCRGWDSGIVAFVLSRMWSGARDLKTSTSLLERLVQKAREGMLVVVLVGEEDRVVRPAAARRLADAIPGAQFILVPRCGHVPHEEKPDDFVRLVAAAVGRKKGAI